jgi:hypothetical protein
VGAVLGEVAKRVINGAVLFIAAITFFLVPVGRKTLAQHVMAIFGTEPVREAAGACAEAGRRVRGRAEDEWKTARQGGAPAVPTTPAPAKQPAAPPSDLPPAD